MALRRGARYHDGMRIDLSRLHWPQVALLAIVWLSAVGAAITFTVTGTWEKVPTPVWGLLGSLLAGGTASSFLGSVVKPPTERDSTPPTTPAAEARRQHVATLRGEDPTPPNHEP